MTKITNIADRNNSNAPQGPFLARSFNTSVQPGTNAPESLKRASECDCCDDITLNKSTAADDRKTLRKRARRKYLTDGYIGALIDAGKMNDKSTLHKSYWNTWHCVRTLSLQSDGTLSAQYCKNRWCLVCNAIRTAQLIKRYGPTLEAWNGKYFVTLTIPNVEAAALPAALELMQEVFTRCKERLKKRSQRGQCPKFEGLRKLEVTYNPERNDFHPHYHIIVSTEEAAKQLHTAWLQAYNATFESAIWGNATHKAQDVRPATQSATLELFKYFTKVIQGNEKQGRAVYADALDIIFNAVKGRRVFQNFGFIAPADDELTEEEKQEVVEPYVLAEYTWNKDKTDWERDGLAVDQETGEVLETEQQLTGYTPTEEMKDLIENRIIIRPNHNWGRYSRARIFLSQGGREPNQDEQKQERRYIEQGLRTMARRARARRVSALSHVTQGELALWPAPGVGSVVQP